MTERKESRLRVGQSVELVRDRAILVHCQSKASKNLALQLDPLQWIGIPRKCVGEILENDRIDPEIGMDPCYLVRFGRRILFCQKEDIKVRK